MHHALTNPRRIAVAVALALVAGGIPFVVANVESVTPSMPLPSSWTTPSARDGDQGVYNLTVLARDDEAWIVRNESHHGFSFIHRFHWIPLDTWRLVEEIGEMRGGACILNGKPTPSYASDLYVEEQRVGQGGGCDFTNNPVLEEAPGWGGRRLWTNQSQLEFQPDDAPNTHACIHRHALQGVGRSLTDLTGLFADCWIHLYGGSEPEYTTIGTARLGGSVALVVEARVPDPHPPVVGRWFFTTEDPYPVRVEIDLPAGEVPAFSSWPYVLDARDTRWVYELVRFRGGDDLPSRPEPLAPWRTVQWALTAAHEDWDVAWPLADAIAWKSGDPEDASLREFRAGHPAAVVQWAQYRSDHGNQERRDRWAFKLSDGESSLDVNVGRVQVRTTEPWLHHHAGINGPWTEPEYRSGAADYQVATWDAATLPHTPTTDSMRARFLAVAGIEPNTWGRSGCTSPCDGPEDALFYAGFQVTDERAVWADGDVLYASGKESDVYDILAFFDIHGQLTKFSHTTGGDAYGPHVPSDGPGARTIYTPLSSAGEPIFRLEPDLAAAVGLGLAGLVVGAAYWLWPILKVGPLTLFTRIQRSTALEQPTRRQVMDAIQAEPGIHLMDLVRRLDLGAGTVRHHVGKLRDAGIVRVVRHGGYACHFPASKTVSDPRAIVRSEGARRVYDAVENGISSPAAMAKQTHLAVGTVHYHLKRLRQAGLLVADDGAYVVAR